LTVSGPPPKLPAVPGTQISADTEPMAPGLPADSQHAEAQVTSKAPASKVSADQRAAIVALRRYVADHGELPVSTHLPQELPSFWSIRQLFGGWSGYVTAAGFTSRPYRAWDRPATIVAIQRWAESHGGRAPSRAEWMRPSNSHPSEGQVRRVFGTWSAAVSQAGLAPQKAAKVHWTRGAIVDALCSWAAVHGAPTSGDWSRAGHGRPTHALVIRTFGSWNEALRAAGLEPPTGRWSAEQIITAMQAWNRANKRPPRALDWKYADADHPCRALVWKRFGSWDKALRAAALGNGSGASSSAVAP